ncbi:MAG: hypothetical protein ACR2PK_18880 [Acidimicrobiales bacterium]
MTSQSPPPEEEDGPTQPAEGEPTPDPVQSETVSAEGGLFAPLERMTKWTTDLTREAALLPQTLAELRETITDLRQVSARLEGATEGLEVMLNRAESTGVAPLARRLDALATDMEAQLRDLSSQAPGAGLVTQVAEDLQKTLDAFATLFFKPPPKS